MDHESQIRRNFKNGHVETSTKTVLRRLCLIIKLCDKTFFSDSHFSGMVEVEGRLQRGKELADIKEIGATPGGNSGHRRGEGNEMY